MGIGIPSIFVVFLIFLFIFQHNLRKTDNNFNKSRNNFWEKEEKSMFARKAPIEDSQYVHPHPENLPKYGREYFEELGNIQLFKIQERCFHYTTQPMINLSEILNSDLRLKYGAANLELIEIYENNYNYYIKSLYSLAKGYYELNKIPEALQFLEEGLAMQTDISDHVLLLGKIYCQLGEKDKFDQLLSKTTEMKTLTKSKILHGLEQMKEEAKFELNPDH